MCTANQGCKRNNFDAQSVLSLGETVNKTSTWINPLTGPILSKGNNTTLELFELKSNFKNLSGLSFLRRLSGLSLLQSLSGWSLLQRLSCLSGLSKLQLLSGLSELLGLSGLSGLRRIVCYWRIEWLDFTLSSAAFSKQGQLYEHAHTHSADSNTIVNKTLNGAK